MRTQKTKNKWDHFTISEFMCSGKRPGCHECLNMDPTLINTLDLARKWIDAPIIVTSGKRCKPVNDKCGGAANSRHLTGRAADIACRQPLMDELYNWLIGREDLWVKRYPRHIHVHLVW